MHVSDIDTASILCIRAENCKRSRCKRQISTSCHAGRQSRNLSSRLVRKKPPITNVRIIELLQILTIRQTSSGSCGGSANHTIILVWRRRRRRSPMETRKLLLMCVFFCISLFFSFRKKWSFVLYIIKNALFNCATRPELGAGEFSHCNRNYDISALRVSRSTIILVDNKLKLELLVCALQQQQRHTRFEKKTIARSCSYAAQNAVA